jgi:head-tail adaptor
MTVNQHNRLVTLTRSPQTSGDRDGYFEPLTPSTAWCWISPVFGANDGRRGEAVVELRFHRQVTVDTRLSFYDSALGRHRELFVRGVQHIDEAQDLMRLACEEITP